jgi:hypothetical protein
MGSTESNSSGTYPSNNHHHITWEALGVTHQARIPVITRKKERKKRKKERKERKKEKRNLSKNANVTKRKTQQSSTGLLYHPTVSFFSFIWSFSPK